jgi:branched-subunit amino acid aminotransferase/4-amino-4-deoxychorismate lyase
MPTPALIETLRVRRSRIPLLERHEARLERARVALGLPPLAGTLADLVTPHVGQRDVVIRVEAGPNGVAVTMRDVAESDPLSVIVASVRHRPYPHKTTERDAFDAALSEARGANADEVLLLTAEGYLAEGAVTSVFWWEGERLRTPSLELGILPGIGRARAVEGVEVDEGRFRMSDLRGRSVFLTNAVRGVVAVRSLGGEPVPVDPRTAELSRRFWPD